MKTSSLRIINRVFPLTPSIALRIHPDRAADVHDPEFQFRHFKFKVTKLSRSGVRHLNALLVRCAEQTVFFCDDAPWVPPFIAKHAAFRIQPVTRRLQQGSATVMINTLVVTDDPD